MSLGSSACHLEVGRSSVRTLEVACCTSLPGADKAHEVVHMAGHSPAEVHWAEGTADCLVAGIEVYPCFDRNNLLLGLGEP